MAVGDQHFPPPAGRISLTLIAANSASLRNMVHLPMVNVHAAGLAHRATVFVMPASHKLSHSLRSGYRALHDSGRLRRRDALRLNCSQRSQHGH